MRPAARRLATPRPMIEANSLSSTLYEQRLEALEAEIADVEEEIAALVHYLSSEECGFATGARQGWLYLIEDMQEQIEAAEQAPPRAAETQLLLAGAAAVAVGVAISEQGAPDVVVVPP